MSRSGSFVYSSDVAEFRARLVEIAQAESEDCKRFQNPLDHAAMRKAYWRHDAIQQCLVMLDRMVLGRTMRLCAQVLVYEPRLTHSVWVDYGGATDEETGKEIPRTEEEMLADLREGVRAGKWVGWRLLSVEREVLGNDEQQSSCSGMDSKSEEAVRCPECGYTEEDARIHGDHHLCGAHAVFEANPAFQADSELRKGDRVRVTEEGRRVLRIGTSRHRNGALRSETGVVVQNSRGSVVVVRFDSAPDRNGNAYGCDYWEKIEDVSVPIVQ